MSTLVCNAFFSISIARYWQTKLFRHTQLFLAFHRLFGSPDVAASCHFPALGTDYMFSRDLHWLSAFAGCMIFLQLAAILRFVAFRLVACISPHALIAWAQLSMKPLLLFFNIPDKMEAAAAGINAQRTSTGGSNTASTESQNTTPVAAKTNTTGSETGQTSTATPTTAAATAVSSGAPGMFMCLYFITFINWL